MRLRAGRVLRRDFGADASERDAGAEVLAREKWSRDVARGKRAVAEKAGAACRRGKTLEAWLMRSFAALFSSRRHGELRQNRAAVE